MDARKIAALAALLADDTRAAVCLALLDGRAWTAGELARRARVAPSTASGHLGKLVAGGLPAEERQGRHRHVRLADERAAELVERLASYTAPDEGPSGSLRAASARTAMARGRTCYDHLAGRLGIAITDAMTGRGLLRRDTGFALTDDGLGWFRTAGIPLPRGGRRPLARACLDWTECRPRRGTPAGGTVVGRTRRRTARHLAGAAGAELCRHALAAGWCERIGSQRAVRVTADGERALGRLLGIGTEALR
ncbi:winged helix-turn-helix domain-containing protein [Streptomyces sp. NPDC007883]|uniref:ArsR/SmtB family transcription factor n=1 Tax=Streptomyces sp. NPDC007883 TaxID=3155116 RepID=UPI0033C8582D